MGGFHTPDAAGCAAPAGFPGALPLAALRRQLSWGFDKRAHIHNSHRKGRDRWRLSDGAFQVESAALA